VSLHSRPVSESAPHTAVFLLNLGGPQTLDEVRPYLYQLFADRKILQLPTMMRLPLAALISTMRAPSSRSKYALIGNGSPLVKGTREQGDALQALLGNGFTCHLAMRCGKPSTREAVAEALGRGARRAVALPLYPQYARATTLSSFEELRERWPRDLPLFEVPSYPDDPGFIGAAAECLDEALATLSAEDTAHRLVVFSAHGLPLRDIERGDPYESEVQRTARALVARSGLREGEWALTYQSRVAPLKWLGPDTVAFVRANARDRAMVLVPVAFVSEHLETLYDLDILAKDAALQAGARIVVRAKAVGARPAFIAALAELVKRAIANGRPHGAALSA
jgi:protoporphyrin/coproporphyrin ferrochelatase